MLFLHIALPISYTHSSFSHRVQLKGCIEYSKFLTFEIYLIMSPEFVISLTISGRNAELKL